GLPPLRMEGWLLRWKAAATPAAGAATSNGIASVRGGAAACRGLHEHPRACEVPSSCDAARSCDAGVPAAQDFSRGEAGRAPSGATVDVVQPHDVVLAEVAAGLHLDQLQRHLARVAQAVHAAERDVGALVLAEQEHLV